MIHPRQNEDIRRILAVMKEPRRLAFENDVDHGKLHAETTLEFGEKLIQDERYKGVNLRAAAIALFFHDFGNTLNRFFDASQARRQTARVELDKLRKNFVAEVEEHISGHEHERVMRRLLAKSRVQTGPKFGYTY